MKGKPFDSLITKTIEGIDLQPLYTQESLAKRAQPIRAAKKETGWIVAQQPYATDGQQFVAELKNSIERGNEAIVCDGTKQLHWDESSLAEIAQLMKQYPIFITNMKHDNSFLESVFPCPRNGPFLG